MIEILSYNNEGPFQIDQLTNSIINSLNNRRNNNSGLTLTEIREHTELLNNNEQNLSIYDICREVLNDNENNYLKT